MKKRILFVIMFCLLLGCTTSGYKEITYNEFEKMIEKKESFILMIGAESCSHCATYKTTINSVIKDYDVTVYYIDVDKLSETENSKLKKVASYTGTPTTVFITEGKEESTYTRIVGDRDYDYVVKKFQNNGYIEEVKE